jgi:hypothetical protein
MSLWLIIAAVVSWSLWFGAAIAVAMRHLSADPPLPEIPGLPTPSELSEVEQWVRKQGWMTGEQIADCLDHYEHVADKLARDRQEVSIAAAKLHTPLPHRPPRQTKPRVSGARSPEVVREMKERGYVWDQMNHRWVRYYSESSHFSGSSAIDIAARDLELKRIKYERRLRDASLVR